MLTKSQLLNNVTKFLVAFNIAATCLLISPKLPAQSTAVTASGKTTALFNAIRSGSPDLLKAQIANGADVNDSINSYSALMAATLNGSIDQMKILIEHGANVNYQTSGGISALWLAIPDAEKTILLLEHGADINHQVQGYGVLAKLAAIPGTINLFHLLIDKGADLKKSAPANFLVYNAASSGDTAILGYLLRNGFNAKDTAAFGDYPLNAALSFRSFATLKMLVDNGADVNVKAPSFFEALVGFTPLMNAAIYNERKSFFYLLEHGADPNLKSKKGFTALMLLEQSETIDDPDMTLALINHGAIVSAKAQDGTDALYYAMKKGNTQSAELLKKYANK